MTDLKFRLFFVWIFFFSSSQKIMLVGFEARTFSTTCRLRGQGQRLELRGQGYGLQNVFSRPSKSSRTAALYLTLF